MNEPQPLKESPQPVSSGSIPLEELDLDTAAVDPHHDYLDRDTPLGSTRVATRPSVLRYLGYLAAPVLVVAGAIAVKSMFFPMLSEGQHDNWKYVAAAADASAARQVETFVRLDPRGNSEPAPALELTRRDLDLDTSSRVKRALAAGDLAAANTALVAGQRIPISPVVAPGSPQPQLPPHADMLQAIKDGRSQFFHLQMFDSCDEDGDVVQVSINGQKYATVPLTHNGATISVPLRSGTTALAIQGIRDGGGGITIRFQSSQGDYFCRAMEVGEVYHLGVAVP